MQKKMTTHAGNNQTEIEENIKKNFFKAVLTSADQIQNSSVTSQRQLVSGLCLRKRRKSMPR